MRRLFLGLMTLLTLSNLASAQNFSTYVSGLPQATLPFGNSDMLYVLQGGVSKRLPANQLTSAVPIIGTPTLGNVPIATSPTTAVWGQLSCSNLSNASAGCSTAIGTSGGTIPLLSGTNTWSSLQTFSAGITASVNGVNITGVPSAGYVPIATNSTNAVWGQLACSSLSNSVASCSTDATNASNISSGTLASARGGAGSINGALKGNGAGVVSQAACVDLSNGATGCSTAVGTSGATIPLLNGINTWVALQTFNGGIAGSGPVNMGNTTVPGSFSTPAYALNDQGVTGFNFSDGSTHFGTVIVGNTPATGTGSYTGMAVLQNGAGRTATGFVTGSTSQAIATGGSGNYTGNNPYVVVCGTAVIASQCPSGTAATLNSAVGMEVDIFSNTGATIFAKEGIRIADLGVIQATGTNHLSSGIALVKGATSPGFEVGIQFNDTAAADSGFPIASGGTLIKAHTTALAIDSAFDFSGMVGNFSTAAMILPGAAAAVKWAGGVSFSATPSLVAFQFPGPPATNAALFQPASSFFSGTVTSGNPTINPGAFILDGLTTGAITIQPGNVNAGTYNFNLPVTAGSAGNVLTSGGGGSAPMTWTAGVTTVCTITAGNTYTFTNGVLTTKGANCT